MASSNGMALTVPHINVPDGSLLLPHGLPADNLVQVVMDDLEASLRHCAPGYVWNDETGSCVTGVSPRAAKCSWGYKQNIRLNECRRVKYKYDAEKGTIRKWFDKTFNPSSKDSSSDTSPTYSPPSDGDADYPRPTNKPARQPEQWFGYGYNFGRNEPHW